MEADVLSGSQRKAKCIPNPKLMHMFLLSYLYDKHMGFLLGCEARFFVTNTNKRVRVDGKAF